MWRIFSHWFIYSVLLFHFTRYCLSWGNSPTLPMSLEVSSYQLFLKAFNCRNWALSSHLTLTQQHIQTDFFFIDSFSSLVHIHPYSTHILSLSQLSSGSSVLDSFNFTPVYSHLTLDTLGEFTCWVSCWAGSWMLSLTLFCTADGGHEKIGSWFGSWVIYFY